MEVMGHNIISESNHDTVTLSLEADSTIRTDYYYAEGQAETNKDFDRGHLTLVIDQGAIYREVIFSRVHIMTYIMS